MHQMRISTTHAQVKRVGNPKKKVKTERAVGWKPETECHLMHLDTRTKNMYGLGVGV
jgi:hypothetical protein